MREHSNYQFGFEGGVTIRGLPMLNTYGKDVHWVDSGAGSNGKGTFKRPFSTLMSAIAHADSDDVILVKPGHAETITGVGGLTFDVPGLVVAGLGHGTRRPRFLMDAAADVSAVVSGADTMLRNLQFAPGHADVVTLFEVDAKGFSLVGCGIRDNAANENFLTLVTAGSATDNVCDGMRLIGNRWDSPDAAVLNFLAHTGHLDDLVVEENRVILPAGTNSALIKSTSGDLFRGASILWNFLQHAMTANELLVSNDGTTNSGIIAHNRVGHADVTTTHDLGIDGLGCRLFDNLSTSVDNLSGLVLPAIDTNG
jgi:hypothetical protein